jgi:hypothetical protein
MGLLDDLQMGFGLKERDDDYYERTAATIGREQGSGAEERYRGSNVFQEKPAFGGPLAFFGRGGEGGGITGPRDFVDGGGLGRSGDTFVGGPVSILANLLGIRPVGYNDRDRIGQRAGMGAFDSGVLRPTQSVTSAIPSEDVVDDVVAPSITPNYAAEIERMQQGQMSKPFTSYNMMADEDPIAILSGGDMRQIVPAMPNYRLSVPEQMAALAQSDTVSPLTSLSAQEYLDYLNTGRYPYGY